MTRLGVPMRSAEGLDVGRAGRASPISSLASISTTHRACEPPAACTASIAVRLAKAA